MIYGCVCSRKDVDEVIEAQSGLRAGVYPGTCAAGAAPGKPIRAYRTRVPDERFYFVDRAAGEYTQHSSATSVISSSGEPMAWAYQLAVVVDDSEQG